MFVALEKKLVEVATCKDLASKRTYTVPLKSSSIEVVPLHSAEWQGKGRAIELRQFLDSSSCNEGLCDDKGFSSSCRQTAVPTRSEEEEKRSAETHPSCKIRGWLYCRVDRSFRLVRNFQHRQQ